jgi:hypothetical protein
MAPGNLALQLSLLATWHASLGARDVLNGTLTGWNEIERARQYRLCHVRIQAAEYLADIRPTSEKRSGVLLDLPSLLLLHSLAVGDSDTSSALVTLMAQSRTNEMFGDWSWPVAEFATSLAERLTRAERGPAPNTSSWSDSYVRLLGACDGQRPSAELIDDACDYHLERTRGNSGYPEYIKSPYELFAVEVLAVLRFRGVGVHEFSHPLLSTPLAKIDDAITHTTFKTDEWLDAVNGYAVEWMGRDRPYR